MFQVLIITCLKVWLETVFQVLPTVLTVKLLKRKERMPLKKTEQNRGTDTYRKILIISRGAYFWSKDLFAKFFLGGLYSGGGVYMDKYLRFENTIFVQAIVMFLDFLLTTCLYY